MEDQHNNVVASNVVKTVKNMKRKVETTEGLKPVKTFSVNTDKTRNKATSATDIPDEDQKDEMGLPKSKRPKEELAQSAQLKSGSLNKILPGSTERSGTSNVFSRLTTKKSLTLGPKKKSEKKEVVLNFFDKQYKPTIKGFIETLLTRNKKVNEFLEQKEISKGYVTKRIVQNPHFMICLTNLLNQMFKDEEVDPDLRNIAPGPYAKLENFFMEKVEFEIRMDQLDAEMKTHSNNVARLTKHRLANLKGMLNASEANA